LSLRTTISLTVIAWAVACSLGWASAQDYPPPPASSPYPPAPLQGYSSAPMPPVEEGAPYDPRYEQRAASRQDQSSASDDVAPQRLPTLGGEPALRPPADIGSVSGSDDVTGAIRSPADAAPSATPDRARMIAALPPEDQPEQGPAKELSPQLRRQLVNFATKEPAGTIIIDTPNTYLYLVLGNGKAMRYGIGVGREGFTWSGTERIRRMSEWPDWFPPKEMIERQPYLPRFMAGGDGNPLGARALYLGNTLYRIHGTNQPSTIGTFVSSGCIRLTNEDIEDLYGRVNVGTRVVVMPGSQPDTASAQTPITR
jgi:lipoprotein-anchoring transpeptidase ErfK/SrfK